MTMASLNFDSFWDDLARGNIDLDSDTFKAMVVTDAYTPNKGAHTKRSDVTNEASGAGYSAGGQVVTLSLTKDTVNHREDIAISDPSWPGATLTGRGIVVYKSRGGLASADELVCAVANATDIISTNGTWSFDVNAPLRVQN